MYNGTLFFIRTRKILLSLRFLFFLEFEAQIVLILFLFVVPLINRKFLTFETTSSGKILQYFFYSTDEQLNSPSIVLLIYENTFFLCSKQINFKFLGRSLRPLKFVSIIRILNVYE